MGLQSNIKSTVTAIVATLAVTYGIHLAMEHYGFKDQAPSAATCSELATYASKEQFKDLESFYPYYLCEHSKPGTKLFHFVGTSLWLLEVGAFVTSGFHPQHLAIGAFKAYGMAWASHFFIEVNKPATFKYPLYSFASDHIMFTDLVRMRLKMW